MSEPLALLQPEELSWAKEKLDKISGALSTVLLGKEQMIQETLVALLARGHILLEGLPGLGKTQLVRSLGTLLGLQFSRVQFTPDLLPGDIVGTNILEERDGRRSFVFHPGPVFTNLMLADEINRASPKTQSALLEAMQEQRVTVLGTTHELPDPFFVLATQNPIELEGTYPLPEAQVDRFTFKIDVSGVGKEVLEEIILTRHRGEPPPLAPAISSTDLDKVFALVDRVHLPNPVAGYIARLVDATHADTPTAPAEVKQFVKYGASPRGAIALAEAGRGLGILRGKPNVGFDEVKDVALPALAHRVLLDYSAKLEGLTGRSVVEAVVRAVPEVERPLPEELRSA